MKKVSKGKEGWTKEREGVKLSLPKKEEVEFIRYVHVKRTGMFSRFLKRAAILTIILLFYFAQEISAAKIVAEEPDVVLDNGQLSEQGNGGNNPGQSKETGNSTGQTPEQKVVTGSMEQQAKADDSDGEEEINGGGKKEENQEALTKEKETSPNPRDTQNLQQQMTPSKNSVTAGESDIGAKQLPEPYMGGILQPVVSENHVISQNAIIQKNQTTIHKQINKKNSITNQNDSEQQSNGQDKNQVKQSGTKKQWKAEGEGNALLLGFFGIYGTILFASFLFFSKKGGKAYMKKLLKKVTGYLLFVLCLTMGLTTQAANEDAAIEQAAIENMAAVAEETVTVSENRLNSQDLFTFDWKNGSDEALDHILGITDFEKTGHWLKSLSQEELKDVLAKDTVLPKEMSVASYCIGEDGSMEETDSKDSVIYYEYCMEQATGLLKAQTFQHSSGYYDYKFTMGSALSHYRLKISGLDTSKENTKQQTATVAVVAVQQTHGNFANFTSKAGNYNCTGGYTTKKISNDLDGTGNYYILDAGFTFVKPEGYTVTLTKENAHSGYCNIYYFEEGAYKTNQKKFTVELNSASSVFESLVAHTNLYTNTTVGGSSQNAPETPVCYHFQFTPITYTVQYNGNGATSGSVADQICSYGDNYYIQQNGFSRQYNVIYNGNGGLSGKASDVARYNFNGWGWENPYSVTHVSGQTFYNAKNTQSAVGRFYAIWTPGGVTLPSATRTGYTFAGWSTSSTAQSGAAANTVYTPGVNTNLYATWKANTYKIQFKDGVTDAVKGTQSMTYDKKAKLNTLASMGISRPGYTFKGWKSSVGTYMDGEEAGNLSSENNAVITMTAEWEANNNTPYQVLHKTQKLSNSSEYVLRQVDNFIGTTGTAVTPATREYEGYVSPKKQTVTIAGDGNTQVIYLYDLAPTDAFTYRVEHYLQDKNDKTKYQLDTQNSKSYPGKDGQVVTPDVITTYEGYDVPNPQTVTLKKGSNIVIKYYYKLSDTGNTSNVTNNTNITNQTTDVYKEGNETAQGAATTQGNTTEEGDINHFKPGETKYYTDASGNQYEILVNQDGTLTIHSVKSPDTNSNSLKLAGTVTINNTKYQVTEIAPYAFKNNKTIKTLTIGNGITTIGKGAFEGCTKLKTVKFGVGLSVIGERAFYGCTSLEKVKTTRTLTKIGSKAFYNCQKLKSYSVGKYVKSIGSYAFYNCKKLKKITLAESVEIVEKKAFYKCSSLAKVSIKSTKLIKVGNAAFKKCSKNLKFTVPAKKKKAYAKLLKGKS